MRATPDLGKRIVVIGTAGSGKTTLAQNLVQVLGVSHVELDSLYWGPNWVPLPVEAFRRSVTEALRGDAWVTDGNYSKARDIIWGRADTVVWLDYSFPVIIRRLVGRTLRRLVTQEVLWNDNRESFHNTFLSRNSLFLWVIQTYGKYRKRFPALFAQPEYAHLSVIHLKSPREARDWLETLKPSDRPEVRSRAF